MFTITISPPGGAAASTMMTGQLRRFHTAMSDRTKPHRQSRDYLAKRWIVNFDSNQQIYGAWAPTAQATIDLHGAPRRSPLIRNRTLRNSLAAQARGGKVGRDSTSWNFRKQPVYFFAMHFGWANTTSFAAARGFGEIPPRPLYGVVTDDEDRVHEVFEDFVADTIARFF